MSENLLTIKEVAEILKVSVATVYEYIHKGLIDAIKFSRDYRISETDLEKFINEHKV
jgi:excisionase family DNA binding protein